MTNWTERAKTVDLKNSQSDTTPKSTETQDLGVLGVSSKTCEKKSARNLKTFHKDPSFDETARMSKRLRRFKKLGLDVGFAEIIADKLMHRDRSLLDKRHMCLECLWLSNEKDAWVCFNAHEAGISFLNEFAVDKTCVHEMRKCFGFCKAD
jgi:hypothetical protein